MPVITQTLLGNFEYASYRVVLHNIACTSYVRMYVTHGISINDSMCSTGSISLFPFLSSFLWFFLSFFLCFMWVISCAFFSLYRAEVNSNLVLYSIYSYIKWVPPHCNFPSFQNIHKHSTWKSILFSFFFTVRSIHCIVLCMFSQKNSINSHLRIPIFIVLIEKSSAACKMRIKIKIKIKIWISRHLLFMQSDDIKSKKTKTVRTTYVCVCLSLQRTSFEFLLACIYLVVVCHFLSKRWRSFNIHYIEIYLIVG